MATKKRSTRSSNSSTTASATTKTPSAASKKTASKKTTDKEPARKKTVRASRTVAPMTARRAETRTSTPEQRQAQIAEAAYYRAQARGFEPGHDLADWLAAEAEVDSRPNR